MDGLRKNFQALAFWDATLRTDAQGHVHAEFNAPDSLTRYRIIAVAASRQNQFGTAESAVEINKPVMIEASLPRFGNLGDKVTLRAVLHNNTDAAGEADVELQLDSTAKAARQNAASAFRRRARSRSTSRRNSSRPVTRNGAGARASPAARPAS